MSRHEEEALLRLLEERDRRKRDNPLRFWQPHPGQRAFLLDDARRRFAITSNQWGKTEMGWIEALSHAYGYRLWQVPDLLELRGDLPPREAVPREHWILNAGGFPIQVPNIGFLVTGLAARRGIGEVLWEKFHALWPPSLKVETRMMMGGVPASAILPNGSKFIFGSGEQQDLNTEGITVHYSWVDEPIPQRIYAGLWRGLIRNFGKIWFTMTPLGTKAAWIYHDFISPTERQ